MTVEQLASPGGILGRQRRHGITEMSGFGFVGLAWVVCLSVKRARREHRRIKSHVSNGVFTFTRVAGRFGTIDVLDIAEIIDIFIADPVTQR